MGRQSRLRRQHRAAQFSILSAGMLEVLSVGKGDLKIEIGQSNKDRADAQRLIEEMLRKGYTLFVEADEGLLRVTKFDPERMVYIVADTPGVVPGAGEAPGPAAEADDDGAAAPRTAAGKRSRAPRTVPVAGSKTTAIGRTAGG